MSNPAITESKYRAVKLMLAGGASNEEAGRFLGLHPNTVGQIKKSESLEEYRNIAYAKRVKYYADKKERARKEAEAKRAEEAKKAAETAPKPQIPAELCAIPEGFVLVQKPTPQPQPVPQAAQQSVPSAVSNMYQSNRMLEELKQQNEWLKLISNKLAFVVDELTGKKETENE